MYGIVFSTNSLKNPHRGAKTTQDSRDEVIHSPYLPAICINCKPTFVDMPARGWLKKCLIIEYRSLTSSIIIIVLLWRNSNAAKIWIWFEEQPIGVKISANNLQFSCQIVNWNASGRALVALLLKLVYVGDSSLWNQQITNSDISISSR